QMLPDLSLEYFQGSNKGLGTSLYGVQLGLKVPLLFFGGASKIKAAKIQRELTQMENREITITARQRYDSLELQRRQQAQELAYYEQEGELLSQEILKAAEGNFRNGEIDFFQYIQSLENAFEIQQIHLELLQQYNETVIAINHLTLTLIP